MLAAKLDFLSLIKIYLTEEQDIFLYPSVGFKPKN
jgi:hypothetical protein